MANATRTSASLHPAHEDIATHARLGALAIYSYYRVLLAAALLLLFLFGGDRYGYSSGSRREFYLLLSFAYFLVALSSSLLARALIRNDSVRGSTLIAIDIVSLATLAHASGGASSTITPLLVVTVASGAILLQGKLSYLVAAAATLAMLYEQALTSMSMGMPVTHGSTQGGLLGLAFFGIVVATNQLSARLRQSEALTHRQSQELSELEQLNAHIIQRMRTGILVVDNEGTIRLSNTAAQQMLVPEGWQPGTQIDYTSPELQRRITAWREDRNLRFPPFRNHTEGPEIDTNMTAVQLGERQATLVFLEDLVMLSHHLQQMKLASLGRMTASIAHEIRNPLSAINHAAQLLEESSALPAEDHRLTEIIQQQALRLDRIVDSVLQLSRRQMPRTDLFDLGVWLQEFRTDYLATHTADDILEVRVIGAPPRVRFDPNHLQQVLQNLCDNGLRHGRAHGGQGHVVLNLTSTRNGDAPVLHICDNGPGISEKIAGNLFEPFFTTESKGTGLGLYIARELCEANRARLVYINFSQKNKNQNTIAGENLSAFPAASPGFAHSAGCFQITFSHPGRIAS